MKSEELLYSMEHVGSDLLAAAEQTVLVRKHTSWVKTAAAAVLALAVGVGGFLLLKNLHANDNPVPATNPSTVENHTTEATAQEMDMDALRAELEALFRDEDCDNLNPYVRALTCYYESPALVDFFEFFYNGFGREVYEDKETLEMLKTKYPDYFGDGHLHTDCDCLTEAEMDEVLRQVFGVGIDQTEKRNLDRFVYIPETDTYYHQHGDTNALGTSPLIQDVRTEEDGLVLFTYKISLDRGFEEEGKFSNIRTVALKKENGVYHIVSHLPGEWVTEKAEQENEPETTEQQDADALRAELEALFAVDESHMGQNFYHQALTSAYESPENVKLYQLFHSGTVTDYVESAEEKAKLDEAFPMQFDRVRVSVGEMNGILNQVFGIGFEQVNGHQAFLDSEEKVYLPEADSYYWECTEGNWIYGFSIQDVRTLEDGRVLFTYHREFWDAPEGIWTVCLKKDNGVYHIISNLPGEWVTEKAEQENEPETTEQQDADALRAELEALFRDEDCDNLNPYVRALTCYYESPALVDFFEFFYNGFGREVYEDKETLEMLKTKYPDYFGDGHLHTDCDCLTEAEMDEVLRQVFGVGIDQTEKRNLDRFVYIPETDTYYHQHGDTNALGTSPLIQDVRTEEDGLVLFTYKISLDRGFEEEGKFSNIRTVALKKENGVYHIVSHLPGEFTTAGDLALAPCTDWRMEAEAGDEGPDVRELKVSSTMTYFYQSGDQDSEFNYWCEGSIVYQEDGTLQINIYEIPEDGSIGERTGEPSFDATYACTQENGTIVLTQLSDEGFYNDPKGTVLRFAPDTED